MMNKLKPFLTQEQYKYIVDGILKCSKDELVLDIPCKTWNLDKMIKFLKKCKLENVSNPL